jgi:hypothetical protein
MRQKNRPGLGRSRREHEDLPLGPCSGRDPGFIATQRQTVSRASNLAAKRRVARATKNAPPRPGDRSWPTLRKRERVDLRSAVAEPPNQDLRSISKREPQDCASNKLLALPAWCRGLRGPKGTEQPRMCPRERAWLLRFAPQSTAPEPVRHVRLQPRHRPLNSLWRNGITMQ